MDEQTAYDIEILANVLYLIEHDPDVPPNVLTYTLIAKPSMNRLLRIAAGISPSQPF